MSTWGKSCLLLEMKKNRLLCKKNHRAPSPVYQKVQRDYHGRIVNIGPKVWTRPGPPFFACRPKMPPPPFSKILDPLLTIDLYGYTMSILSQPRPFTLCPMCYITGCLWGCHWWTRRCTLGGMCLQVRIQMLRGRQELVLHDLDVLLRYSVGPLLGMWVRLPRLPINLVLDAISALHRNQLRLRQETAHHLHGFHMRPNLRNLRPRFQQDRCIEQVGASYVVAYRKGKSNVNICWGR